jgi:tetratricopeptide (TPR) repeat protein
LVLSGPELAGPQAFKALVLAHMGLLEGAQTCWLNVLAMDDGNRFEYLDEAMKIDKALNDWEALSNHSLIAMLRYPEKSSGYIYRGMSLTVLGDIDRAVAVYKQGIITASDPQGLKVLQSMLTSIEEALQQ